MTVSFKGRDALQRKLLDQLPKQIAKVLEGAARAGGKVIADEARHRCINDTVRGTIKVKMVAAKDKPTVAAKIHTTGPGAYLAPWIEYGTKPHIIAVRDARDRNGLSVNAINRGIKQGTLVIGGEAVGPIVHHPGVVGHPFLRPAVDTAEAEAMAAAQSYITRKLKAGGQRSGSDD